MMMASTRPMLKTGLAAPVRIGVAASLVLFVILFAWSATTMISGAVIAPGQAVVRGKPKLVQSLDGGVVEEILVKDGDVVAAGDVLLRLDPTLLRIERDILRNRLAEIIAREARLESEYVGAAEIAFPSVPDLLDGISLERHETGQRELFAARAEVLAGQKEQLVERVAQFQNQITGAEGRINATEDQLDYLERELDNVRDLNQRGLVRESELLDLQGNQAELLGQLSEAQAELARLRNSIRDAELEILQADRQFKEEVVTELREVTTQHEELVLQIVEIEEKLARIDIVAPVDGVVHEMSVATVGGVIPPQGTILEVVPTDAGVEFEILVDPKAIDQVHVGQQARVMFPAFDVRTAPEVFGSVATVPPASTTDEATGRSYYRVGLAVPPDQLALLGEVEIIPGMPVEAFLQTGERSVLDYLTKPLSDQIDRAFRE